MTKTERVHDLLATTARLIACMDKEIKLLRAMRPQEIVALQADKMALADAYEAHFHALREARDPSDAVSDVLVAELNEATQRWNIPIEAVQGGPETIYPEYRKKLKDKYVAPPPVVRGRGGAPPQ